MEKIKPLLDRTSKKLEKSSSASLIEAGPTKPRSGNQPIEAVAETTDRYQSELAPDRVDAINQIFAEFEFAYHNQYHKAFANAESLAIAKKYWLSSLENYQPTQIVKAAKRVIRSQDYLPSIAAVVRACEEGFDLFGLPAPRAAYVEACSAPSPKRAQRWSHPAVYLAGQDTGWYTLANEVDAVAFTRFEYHYGELCRRVMNGEDLNLPVPEALPEKIERPLSASERRARIAKMKKELNL
jgi:hypothetical protein